MDRPTETVSTRLLLWGVVAPLLVGAVVPALSPLAVVWLLVGLITLMFRSAASAVRRHDPGEDTDGDTAGDGTDELYEELGATLPGPGAVPVLSGRWWNRTLEDPNTAAARAGSWG